MTETTRLLELLTQNLVEGNFEVLKNLAEQPGLHPIIRESILTITKLFEETTIQSNVHEIEVFFYRDFLKDVMNGEVTEGSINNRLDITNEKKQEAIKLLRRMMSSQQSRISAESELLIKKRQLEELKTQSLIKEGVEKEYLQKERKMAKQLEDRKKEIQELEKNIESQVQIIQESDSRVEQYALKLKLQEAEIHQLKELKASKDQQLNKLKSQIQSILEELEKSRIDSEQTLIRSNNISLQLESKQSFIVEQQKKEQELLSQLSHKEEQNKKLKEEKDMLRSQLEEMKSSKMIKRRSSKDIFVDTNSIIQQFQMNQKVAESFEQSLRKIVGEVTCMSSLYNYSLHKGENFHRRVDNKKNILLLCQTQDNRILGGFSSFGFSMKAQEGRGKAFLFSFYEDNMKIFQLKKGKSSTMYDNDFIIFGNEELCIEKGSELLTSYFVNGPQNILHYGYQNSDERENFLSSEKTGIDQIKLINYEIIELKIKSD